MFALDGFVLVGCNAVCARVATLLGVTALEASQFTERSLPTKISAFPTQEKASFPWPTRDQTRCVVLHVVFRRRILNLVFGTLNCWRINSIPCQTHNKAITNSFLFLTFKLYHFLLFYRTAVSVSFACMSSSLHGAFYDISLTYLNQFIVLHLFCS